MSQVSLKQFITANSCLDPESRQHEEYTKTPDDGSELQNHSFVAQVSGFPHFLNLIHTVSCMLRNKSIIYAEMTEFIKKWHCQIAFETHAYKDSPHPDL